MGLDWERLTLRNYQAAVTGFSERSGGEEATAKPASPRLKRAMEAHTVH